MGDILTNTIKKPCPRKKKNISLLCNLCPLKRNDTCLHLLSCCINKHINNPKTNRHNKQCMLVDTLLTHPTTICFTLINVDNLSNKNTRQHYILVNTPLQMLPPMLQVHGMAMSGHSTHIGHNTRD